MDGVTRKRHTSFDGTEIAYYVAGPADAPWMVLSNGLGGNVSAWRHFIAYFSRRYRIVTWDYRGMYQSAKPSDTTALTIRDHARDAISLVEALGIEEAIFAGWSMGVQVNFELYRLRPDLFTSLVIINGTYGSPFATALGLPFSDKLIPLVLDVWQRYHQQVSSISGLFTKNRAFIVAMKALGLVGKPLDEDVFFDLAKDYVNLDFWTYVEIMRGLGAHDARAVLPTIGVPVLIIAGEHDLFTPRAASFEMQRTIPEAELFIVTGGTHYTPVEYPEAVHLRIEKFLRAHGVEVPEGC